MSNQFKLDPELLRYVNMLDKNELEETEVPTEKYVIGPNEKLATGFRDYRKMPINIAGEAPVINNPIDEVQPKQERDNEVIEAIQQNLQTSFQDQKKDEEFNNNIHEWIATLIPFGIGVLEGDVGSGAKGSSEAAGRFYKDQNERYLASLKNMSRIKDAIPKNYTDSSGITRIGRWLDGRLIKDEENDPVAGYSPKLVESKYDKEKYKYNPITGKLEPLNKGDRGTVVDGEYKPNTEERDASKEIKKQFDTKVVIPYKESKERFNAIQSLLEKGSSETELKIAMKSVLKMFDGSRQSDFDLQFIEYSRSYLEKMKQLVGMQTDPANREQFRNELRQTVSKLNSAAETSFNELIEYTAESESRDNPLMKGYYYKALSPAKKIGSTRPMKIEKKTEERNLSKNEKTLLDFYNSKSNKSKYPYEWEKSERILRSKGLLK